MKAWARAVIDVLLVLVTPEVFAVLADYPSAVEIGIRVIGPLR